MLKEAMLYRQGEDRNVFCDLCNHRCRIADSKFGICGMRQNRDGTLYTYAYGEVVAANVDPIEKKPLYHVLPGSTSFSVAAMGCNFRCGFCQNWQISQASERKKSELPGRALKPADIVRQAEASGCRSIAYTYTEPTIFFEYAYETAGLAREADILNLFVTNGFMTPEALDTINPFLDACNVDLKSFQEAFYQKICHGRLQPVLDSIRNMKSLGIWVEITTLIVPGSNDSENELGNIARFIAETDPDIPWHISRFHPDFEFRRTESTPLSVMEGAYAAGKAAGLRYIYLGNVAGKSIDSQCPRCLQTIVRRAGAQTATKLTPEGRCPQCGARIAGIWKMGDR
ncbi:MAG: AmmeMemoRadiSam system radical SAM enzyme [Deltaproteobacteria bacterium]|jgi:pyruvate formate lyase activating enzyme